MNTMHDFQLLFEASPDVLVVLLPDTPRFTMVAATRARHEATMTTPEQTLGRGLFELFPDNPADAEATGTRNLRDSLERVLATRAPDTMPVQKYDIRAPDGSFEVKYWSPKNIPVLSPEGEVAYILHRVEDVTEFVREKELGQELRDQTRAMEREVMARSRELAKANADLRDANAKLGKLDVAKTAFFSNVSHEFRTPLTLMLGPLEDALADSGAAALAEPQRNRIALAHGSALRLLKLVNALLDFARLEAGRLEAHFAPVDISRLTADLAHMFQSAIVKAGLRLVVDCPPLSEPVFLDRDQWEKIVPNLVSNALKFTMSGTITVRVREENTTVVLEVSDTGIGIPAAELPRIFDRFHRVESSLGRTHEGTGIGLSLVRELTLLHGGQVQVDSELGRGTTFRVELPKGSAHLPPDAVSLVAPAPQGRGLDAVAHSTEASALVAAPAARRQTNDGAKVSATRAHVIVVDDNPDLRRYMTDLLSPDYDVSTASDGMHALESIRSCLPDVVVSDVMMPRLDGNGLVRELRADPRTTSLPVILVSARAGEESTVEGLDAGADDYVLKPFSARELRARVRTHVELARKRREWIAELERANRELEAFSYSVSHDLRGPLRVIDGFARALSEDYGPALDAQASDYIEQICSGASRMANLIEDLLALARITRTAVKREVVDLSALSRTVVAALERSNSGPRPTVEIADALAVRGDPALLHIVLENLIGNAWKFSSKTAHPHIEIGRHAAKRDEFYVRDNGAGFDMAYANRLFAPFQRLHAKADFEGTGVGLATVQRVIHRHGGRVWAEAAPGRGATFFFSVPHNEPSAHGPLDQGQRGSSHVP